MNTPIGARRSVSFAVAALLALVGLLSASPALAQASTTVPRGTVLRLQVESSGGSSEIRPNDPFRATVTSPITVGSETVIPAGSVLSGRVVTVGSAGIGGPSAVVRIRVERLTSPTGASIDIVGDLVTPEGQTVLTGRDLAPGSGLELRLLRPVTVGPEFYARSGGGQGTDVLDTPATVSQAQAVLRDLGYYSGPVNGRLNRATRDAIGLFQRDQRLAQTGFLDRETIERLGLVGQGGVEVSTVNVVAADTVVRNNDQLHVTIRTQNPAGMQIFEDHFRQRDTLHIYVRGFRPTAGGRSTTSELSVVLQPNEWQGLARIVVHGSGENVVIPSDRFAAPAGALSSAEAAELERQIAALLSDYALALGLRYNAATGQIVMTRANYRENEMELLFALNSLAASARLYTQIVRATEDPQALAGATDLFVNQANVVDRALQRTNSGRANVVARAWPNLRDDFERMDNSADKNFNRQGVGYRP